jgi:serine/threonine protein kinase
VQHAHQKAIIHRDLKPSNVLVGQLDQKPGPQDHRLRPGQGDGATVEATMYTEVGGIVGTAGLYDTIGTIHPIQTPSPALSQTSALGRARQKQKRTIADGQIVLTVVTTLRKWNTEIKRQITT